MLHNCQLFTINKYCEGMTELNRSNYISLVGEIIGIYENQGERFVKLRYDPGYVDISLQEIQDVYLGDKVTVDSDLTIKKISPQTEENTTI